MFRTMFWTLCLVLFGVLTVEGLDRKRLCVDPYPDPNFTNKRWRGEWFVQARSVPRSYYGSVEFTDFKFNNIPEADRFVSPHIWRDGPTLTCAGAKFFAYYTAIPGVFKLKDTIGNVYSGDWIVAFLDSRLGLELSWGCTDRYIDGRCQDPWVSVKTRLRHPPTSLLAIAEKYLRKLFGMTLAEMEQVPHLKPC